MVSEGSVRTGALSGFGIVPRRLNRSALKNLAGTLHTEALECTLSVGPEVKTEIPACSGFVPAARIRHNARLL